MIWLRSSITISDVDSSRLSEIVQRVQDGRLRTNIDNISTLDDAVAVCNSTERRKEDHHCDASCARAPSNMNRSV